MAQQTGRVRWRSATTLVFAVRLLIVRSVPLSDWRAGILTHYGGAQDGMSPYDPSFGTKEGACGYGLLPKDRYPYWSVAALSLGNIFSIAGPSHACGQCFEVKCVDIGGAYGGRCSKDTKQQSVIVTITDVCPECAVDHMDMQALTFNKLSPMELGRINMLYRRVECTPPEPLKVEVDANVGVGAWLRIVVERAAGYGGVSLVQMKGSDSSWAGMTNKYGSAWEVPVTPKLPWDFRFVSDDKQELTAFGLINSQGRTGEVPTGVQFALINQQGGNNPVGVSSATNAALQATGLSTQAIPADNSNKVQSQFAQAAKPLGGAPSTGRNWNRCPCDDIPPSNTWTCQQQGSFGKCGDGWMQQQSADYPNGFCAVTCGRCPSYCGGQGR